MAYHEAGGSAGCGEVAKAVGHRIHCQDTGEWPCTFHWPGGQQEIQEQECKKFFKTLLLTLLEPARKGL